VQNVYVNINRILTVASRLVDTGHYAARHIEQVAGRLDRAWKEFAAGLDERTAMLNLSIFFHQSACQVIKLISTPLIWSSLKTSKEIREPFVEVSVDILAICLLTSGDLKV
jgi:hypothetical protein